MPFISLNVAVDKTVDVAWIGQSLHHLLAPAKVALMRRVRAVLGDRGLFLIW